MILNNPTQWFWVLKQKLLLPHQRFPNLPASWLTELYMWVLVYMFIIMNSNSFCGPTVYPCFVHPLKSNIPNPTSQQLVLITNSGSKHTSFSSIVHSINSLNCKSPVLWSSSCYISPRLVFSFEHSWVNPILDICFNQKLLK